MSALWLNRNKVRIILMINMGPIWPVLRTNGMGIVFERMGLMDISISFYIIQGIYSATGAILEEIVAL